MSKHELVCEQINGTITHCSINMSELLYPDVIIFAIMFSLFAWFLWS